MFIGAYWSQRKESKESAARRVSAFLGAVAGCGDEFVNWYSKGKSRAAALRSPLGLDAASIEISLKPNRRDSNRQSIPNLGYSLGIWNGIDTSFSAAIGSWSEHVRNSVVLKIGPEGRLGDSRYRTMIEEIVRAFDPDHAVVTSHEWMTRAGVTLPWEAGVFTYTRGGTVQEHSMPQ